MDNLKKVFEKLKEKILYGSRFQLRPYEQLILDAWREHLSSEAKAILSRQLELLPVLQDQAGGKLVVFFQRGEAPYPPLPEEVLFPCRLEECIVARIYLEGKDRRGRVHHVRAEIELDYGELSFFIFDKPPKKRLIREVRVKDVKILRDPMEPVTEETISNEQRIKEKIAEIDAKFPDEYLQLIGDKWEVTINEWKILGIRQIWKIPQYDGTYYILAVKQGTGVIGVREGDYSGQLYFIEASSECGEEITIGLREFLERYGNDNWR